MGLFVPRVYQVGREGIKPPTFLGFQSCELKKTRCSFSELPSHNHVKRRCRKSVQDAPLGTVAVRLRTISLLIQPKMASGRRVKPSAVRSTAKLLNLPTGAPPSSCSCPSRRATFSRIWLSHRTCTIKSFMFGSPLFFVFFRLSYTVIIPRISRL